MWHPRATALDDLHRAGKLSVLPAIGYTDPDQSHFTSRHYWEVGELDPNERTGWLGRLIDVIGVDDNPIQGLSLDGWLLPSLATASKPVAAIEGSRYDLWAPGVWGDVEPLMFEAVQAMGQTAAGSGDLGRVSAGKTADQSIELRSTLDGFGEVTVPGVYPDPDHWFCQNMSSLSAMIDGDLPIRCVSVSAPGGYDTHDNQGDTFADDIGITFDTLAAFQADLEARGLADRVITLVYSEFGRRPEQYGSGTDHGAAGAAFVMGTRVQGEMVGEFPGLAQLDEDDNVLAHLRLPLALLLDPRAMVRRRRGPDHPGRVELRAPADHRAMNARPVAGALAGALCLVAGWSLAGSASAGDKPPTTVGLRNGASEFSFTLSRTKVDPGPAIVQYQNTGEDPHDVKILRRGRRRRARDRGHRTGPRGLGARSRAEGGLEVRPLVLPRRPPRSRHGSDAEGGEEEAEVGRAARPGARDAAAHSTPNVP